MTSGTGVFSQPRVHLKPLTDAAAVCVSSRSRLAIEPHRKSSSTTQHLPACFGRDRNSAVGSIGKSEDCCDRPARLLLATQLSLPDLPSPRRRASTPLPAQDAATPTMPQNKMQKIKAQMKMGEKKVNVVSVEPDQGSAPFHHQPRVRFSTSAPSPCPPPPQ